MTLPPGIDMVLDQYYMVQNSIPGSTKIITVEYYFHTELIPVWYGSIQIWYSQIRTPLDITLIPGF